MNPTQRPVQRTNRLMMQDIAKPAAAQSPSVVEQDIRPTVVENIPVQQQAGPPGHDDDLDKIMKEVDTEMKAADKKPEKHHLFQRQPKTKVKQSALPKKSSPQPVPLPAAAIQPVPKKDSQNTAPVMTIVLALLVTGMLAAAAVYAYK